MKRWSMIALGCAPLAWEIAASWLFCVGRQRDDLFVFPYMQWVDYAVHWRRMAYMPEDWDGMVAHPLFWFVAGGLLSALLVGVPIWSVMRRLAPKETLFGDSQWASSADMRRAGITRHRS